VLQDALQDFLQDVIQDALQDSSKDVITRSSGRNLREAFLLASSERSSNYRIIVFSISIEPNRSCVERALSIIYRRRRCLE
jgi:hypothetical protein